MQKKKDSQQFISKQNFNKNTKDAPRTRSQTTDHQYIDFKKNEIIPIFKSFLEEWDSQSTVSASTLSKAIRYGMTEITDQFYDGGMVNRLTNQNRSILAHCYDKNTQKFIFNETSFNRLVGFEFNLKSPITNSLWVEPQTTLSLL